MAPWYRRGWDSVGFAYRSMVAGFSALRRPPARPGITTGRAATLPHGEADLASMASSPPLYGALTRSALSFTTYPIRCYRGFSIGGGNLEPLDNDVPWVGAFLRLLQTPDPLSADELFPEPGEGMIAQIFADLKMLGVFVVAPTLTEAGDVSGLTRLHPGCCAIERTPGREELVYRNGSEVRRYPRRQVCVGHLLHWARDGRSEFGVGAGVSLRPLVRAEAVALNQTANMVEQGGADVVIKGKGATGKNFMASEANREAAVKAVTTALRAPDGRRVFAYSDEIEVEPSNLKPADLQAPEMLNAARGAYLVALGVVPAWVGIDSGTYANGVLQFRTQYDMDEAFQAVIEAYFLRPLARRFALRAGGRTAKRVDEITARIDLWQHPGAQQMRTDALGRMDKLQIMGYSVEQSSAIEGMDLPAPKGPRLPSAGSSAPLSAAGPQPPGPAEGSHLDDPRRPVGDQGDGAVNNPPARLVAANETLVSSLFARDAS